MKRLPIIILSGIYSLCVPPYAQGADESWTEFPLSLCSPGKESAELGNLAEAVKKWAELSPYAYAAPRTYAVGRCLDDSFGIETVEDHYQKLKDAAKQGSSNAELYLAVEHLQAASKDEKAGTQNSDHAVKGMIWLKRAVAHKNADAKALLAFHLMNGTYIERDLKRGQELLHEAAEAGSLAACEELAEAFRAGGFGLPIDPPMADKWRQSALDLAASLHSRSIFENDGGTAAAGQ